MRLFSKNLILFWDSRLHLQIMHLYVHTCMIRFIKFYNLTWTRVFLCILSSICPTHQMHSGLLKRSPERINAKQFNILSASANMNLKLRIFALNLLRGAFRFARRLLWRHSSLPFAIDPTVTLLLKPLLFWINACVRVCIFRVN